MRPVTLIAGLIEIAVGATALVGIERPAAPWIWVALLLAVATALAATTFSR